MAYVSHFGGFGPGTGAPFGGGSDDSAPFGGANWPSMFQRKNRPPRKPMGGPVARTLINLAVTAVAGFFWFYLTLPALNVQAEEFYFFLFLLCALYCLSAIFTSGFSGDGGYFRFVWKQCKIPLGIVLAMVAVVAVGSLSSWVVLRAGAYSALLPLQTGDFASDVEEIRYDQIPMLDGASAALLGNRKLGELADMVSQFEILPTYDMSGNLSTTQINFKGRPVRVTSLAYGDIIKWFNNRASGLPAYIVIDMVTREAEVIRLKEGIRFTTAEHFGRNLPRHLRFQYPTMMFDTPVFEIDEDGTPWWVCPRLMKTIGLFGGLDVRGAVLVNAQTGESRYYEEVPSWVDRLYSADIIIQQYNYYGRYHNGFLNSILGQREVTVTTDGYNYIAIGDDVYMYTGITSVTSDESNIGFILSNQRTKETRFYSIAGAEEYSAMASAQSQVQQMRYNATFPLLLNIAGQPTYFMAMKGADGLVKMYAMVNVQQYDIVSTGATVGECEGHYRETLRSRGIITAEAAEPEYEVRTGQGEGVIEELRTAVIDGNTHVYARLDNELWLDIQALANNGAILLNVGDRIVYSVYLADGSESNVFSIFPVQWFRLAEAGGEAVETAEEPDSTAETVPAEELPAEATPDPERIDAEMIPEEPGEESTAFFEREAEY